MTNTPKNHTISKIAAKLSVRLFLILLLMSIAPFILDKESADNLGNTYLYVVNKWVLIFPLLLFVFFIVLLFITLKHNYSKVDLNWMLTLNAALLIIYVVLLYIRIFPLIFN